MANKNRDPVIDNLRNQICQRVNESNVNVRVLEDIAELLGIGFRFPITKSRVLSDKDFTIRDEANAFTADSFRNRFLEDLHAGEPLPKEFQSDKYSKITQEEMKTLMIDASKRVKFLLRYMRTNRKQYREFMRHINAIYCFAWER